MLNTLMSRTFHAYESTNESTNESIYKQTKLIGWCENREERGGFFSFHIIYRNSMNI